MTTLQITPNWKNKTAKFKGTIAAGEHVAVTIQNDNGYVESTTNLRLRVVDSACGRMLAVFPQPVEEGETPETWGVDTTPLTCELNLNTVQMLKAVPPAATVPLLFVLDDKEADTLYFKDMCDVTHWPMELGEDVPYDLVGYPDFVEEAKQAIKDAQDAIKSAVDEATGIVAHVDAAKEAAETARDDASTYRNQAEGFKNLANDAKTAAETAQGKAETAQGKAETAQGKAEDAQAAAETAAQAAEAALPLDTTLSNSGKAADAKAVGDALKLKASASTTYSKTEVDNAIAQEARLRASGDQSLANDISALGTSKANKTDLADFFDGAEYDSNLKRIYFKHGQNRIDYIDATVFIKDGMVSSVAIIKVPDDEEPAGVADGNYLKVMFNTDAGRDPIYIPLTDIFNPDNYYDKTAADGKFVAKEAGKGLSTEDYTTAEKTKLGGIAAGAQVNVIETVKVNGTALTPQDKVVNIPVPTLDDAVTRTSSNGVKSSGIWSAIWGALAALPTGFTSLYDWVVAQLARKLSLSGGTMTGDLQMGGCAIGFGVGTDVTLGHQVRGFGFRSASGEVIVPLNRDGTLAFVSQIPDVTALLQQIAAFPAFDAEKVGGYAVGDMVTYQGQIYECTTAHSGAWAAGDFTARTLGYLLGLKQTKITVSGLLKGDGAGGVTQAVAGIDYAGMSDLRYAISESIPLTVTSGAASTTLADRTHNVRTVAAPGSGNTTTITATLPPIVAGKSRDMFLNLTVGSAASDEGDISLSIVEPSGATVQIDIGSVEDIGIGKNEILISENALPTTSGNVTTTHWLVTVRHEDFAS